MARIFTWYSDNNEQIQTLTPPSGPKYFDFGTHSVGEGCHVFYRNLHYFIGGKFDQDGIGILDPNSCKIEDVGFRTPAPMKDHSCTVHQDYIWMCASYDDPKRCYT
jgi:hypothetical protein